VAVVVGLGVLGGGGSSSVSFVLLLDTTQG
jgi:hypothetical protein